MNMQLNSLTRLFYSIKLKYFFFIRQYIINMRILIYILQNYLFIKYKIKIAFIYLFI